MMANRTNGLRNTSRAAALFAALIAGLLTLLLGAAGPVHAVENVPATLTNMPDGPQTLVIHPGLVPGPFDAPGNGLPPRDGAQPSPPGYAYEIKRVPGLDLHKTSDWNRATEMTPAEAAALVANEPIAGKSITAKDGSLVFGDLETGLYYVTETQTPAGELRTAPFLVALPLPHPTETNEWLNSVHVYPKNARVNVKLSVQDADAVTNSDTVRWTSLSAIPFTKTLDSYRVREILAEGVQFQGKFDGVRVEITGQPALTPGDDYTIAESNVTGRSAQPQKWAFEVTFTKAGIAKLLVDTNAQVRITYDTTVSYAGEHINEVLLFAGDADPVSDTAITKFGPIRILVHERGNPQNLIEGAKFRLYTNEADALAGTNPIRFPDGTELFTVKDGTIDVPALRYSGFADGLDREPSDELFRSYFAKPDSYPAGWTGETMILQGTVASASEPQTLIWVVWKGDTPVVPPTPPVPPVLTETGGKVIAAAVLGSVLLLVGGLALARRRRQGDAPSA